MLKLNNRKLQILMAKRILTVNELASKTGFSRIHIGRLISGKSAGKPASIGKIAAALDVDVTDIIENSTIKGE